MSIDAEKSFEIIQDIFIIKTQQSGDRGNVPKYNTGHILQTYWQHHTQWAKSTSVPCKIRSAFHPSYST